MEQFAAAQINIDGTDKYIFKKHDGQSRISPHRFDWFGGEILSFESNLMALNRELQSKTSLNVARLRFERIGNFEVPEEYSSTKKLIRVNLFETTILKRQLNFDVLEGSHSEPLTYDELLQTNEVSSTLRYIIESAL